jgi:prepilin-type N-terminal cleavage/methylation domain-containing protein
MRTCLRRLCHGFTLIELLTVITNIGILAAILISTAGAARNTARTSSRPSNLRKTTKAGMVDASENKSILPLGNDGEYLSDGKRRGVQLKPSIGLTKVPTHAGIIMLAETAVERIGSALQPPLFAPFPKHRLSLILPLYP